MSTANPYAPPRAAVADVIDDGGGVQPVQMWSSQGRIGRLRFLAHMTGAYLVLILVAFVLGAIFGLIGLPKVASVVGGLGGLVYMVFALLKTIQRSHDMDWSGWTCLLALIPFVGLVWIFKGGSQGSNRFGAPAPANTTGVKILGLVLPVLMFIGIILAVAVAVPAYDKYVQRAKAAQMK